MVVNIDKFIDGAEATVLSGGFAAAPVSKSPELVTPISGTTAATTSTLPGSAIITQDHPDGSTTGTKFEFIVPDDYDSGTLDLTLIFATSTAVATPNNVMTLEIGAEIAQASTGSIDTATYPLANVALTTPDNSTDITQSVLLLSIAPADFAPGDKVLFFVKRLGSEGADVHTGVLQIIDYIVTYTGQIAARRSIVDVAIFSDTDETAPVAGTKSSFDTLDFTTGVDREKSFQFTIPEQWDGFSDFNVQLTYAMSTAAALVVYLQTEGEIANVGTGAIDTLGVESFSITTTADTNPARSTSIRTVSGVGRQPGDVVYLKIARRGSLGADTHTGDLQLIGATVFIGTGPSSAVSILSQMYLNAKHIEVVSGTVTGATEAPDYGGDFELYTLLSSTTAAARIDVEWAGELATNQTRVDNIQLAVKGSAGAEYQLKVYVEGQGATAVYDSGLVAAPLTRTLLSIAGSNLTGQPTGGKRYFVVVEGTLDNTETLRVGNPFVRQG